MNFNSKIGFDSHREYLGAKIMYEANTAASDAWRKENKTNGIPKEVYEKFPYANEVTNELRSAIEVYEFIANPPKKYFLYVDEKTGEVTTWTGQKLGRFTVINGYRSNMRDFRISIRIKAINGKEYYGTYYKSAGSYARITMCKSSETK